MSNMKLSTKLITTYLLVGIIPFAVVGLLSLNKARSSLDSAAFNQLVSIQSIKKGQIENYFNERFGDVTVLAGNPTVAEAMVNFEEAFEAEGDRAGGSLWTAVEHDYGPWLTQYNNEYGYYDLFLISSDGDIVFTVAKESDFGQNVINSALSTSSLGICFKKAQAGSALADFQPYAPSNGEPAAFIGAPVEHEGETVGVVALQIPLDAINNIMQERSGLGETGETYLVGPNKLMRSDSYLDPENHTVIASFANPSKGSVDTEASREALEGRSDAKIITDYNGNPVLSAYSPVSVGDLTWAILAEIDKAEAFAAVKALTIMMGIVGVIGLIAIIAVAVMTARSITGPINKVIAGMNEGADQVASASIQVSSSSQQLAEGSSEQASSIEEISASLEEMTSMTRQNATNARQANDMANAMSDSASKGSDAMIRMEDAINRIKSSSDETAKIIKTIDEIAFQTNLLALNAAVEAARAGEAGAGFAVVADEVRNLAMRAAEAAKNTAALIEESQVNAKDGVSVSTEVSDILREITDASGKVKGLINEVSSASAEQSQGIDQVNTAVNQMDQVTQSAAANAEESASASEEMSSQAAELKEMVGMLIGIVGGSAGGNGNGGGASRRVSGGVHGSNGSKRLPSPKRETPAPVKKEYASVVAPDDVIPLDDDEFEDF